MRIAVLNALTIIGSQFVVCRLMDLYPFFAIAIAMKNVSSLHKMRKNYDSNENVYVIHKCSKNFWRQRQIVDVYIIKHCIFHILEIVCFLPHLSVEVPRVYISSPALVELLDKEEIEENVTLEKNFSSVRERKSIKTIFWRKLLKI